jgi:hypothetical protein
VADARRDVAEFNKSVESMRAELDSILVRLEHEGGIDSRVAEEVRELGRRITSGVRANIRLSPNFTLADLSLSETAGKRGIENAPDPDAFERLRYSAEQLERLREVLGGCPIRINSGYRGPTLSAALGSSRTSAHTTGYAVDITCKEFGTPYQIARAIEQSQVMDDIDELYLELGNWVHISFDPQKRHKVLTSYRTEGGQGRTPHIVEVGTDGRLIGPAPQ